MPTEIEKLRKEDNDLNIKINKTNTYLGAFDVIKNILFGSNFFNI